MKKIDATVRRETGYIAAWVLILSMLMQAIFLIIGKWDYTVLTGNLLAAAVAVGNFLLLGITVQNAVQRDAQDAKSLIRLSLTLRMLPLIAAVTLAVVLPVLNVWAGIIPLFFPRIALMFRPYFGNMKEGAGVTASVDPATDEEHAAPDEDTQREEND